MLRIIFITSLLFFAACDDVETESMRDHFGDQIGDTEIPGGELEQELPVLEIPPGEVDELSPDASACECESPACVRSWIADNIGCDVCAVMTCDGGDIGACALCDDVEADADVTGHFASPLEQAAFAATSTRRHVGPPPTTL